MKGYTFQTIFTHFTKMKTQRFTYFATGMICLGFFVGCNASQFSAKRDYEKAIPINSQVEVIVETFNGSIVVTPCDQLEVQVLAHMRSGGNTQEEADEAIDSLIPDFDTTATALKIKCKKRPGLFNFSDSVSLELKVPAKWPLVLSTSNGFVTVNDCLAPVSVDTSNGQVQVVHAVGQIRISTSNGKVNVEHSTGNIQAKSSNGNMRLTNCELEGDCTLETSNGSIEASFAADTPLELDATTSNGSIRYSEADVELKHKSKTSISGIWLGGSTKRAATKPSIGLHTSNGSITLKPFGEDRTPTMDSSSKVSNL